MIQDKDWPIQDLDAADKFRNTLVEKADADLAGAPLWHGWAIMEAFLAGIEYASQGPDIIRTYDPTIPYIDRHRRS